MAPVRRRVTSKFELAVDLDYRCPIDDAWYRVRVLKFRDRALRIMYVDFSEAPDEWYGSRQFQSSDELEELLSRFRYPAKQLEDKQCDHVTTGQLVVACQEFYDGSLSFYDACVNSVSRYEHWDDDFTDEEVCTCEFNVTWKHGPEAGKNVTVGVRDICFIVDLPIEDSYLKDFFDTARKYLEEWKTRLEIQGGSSLDPATSHGVSLCRSNSPELKKCRHE